MRKLSIVLLLISISFMTMKANNLSEHKSKYLVLKRWDYPQRALVPIPIEAIQDENSIEVRFLENVDNQVTFQVKDQQGNIIFQDVLLAPNEQETYKINLEDYQIGHYELLYIEEDMTFIGELDIEHSIL
ncbi:MAG TPA: DUF3244 domain-containing protein [Bacteroides xylanisolvens]|uniref:DUF3244 domain-containing protein n=1 Tax=Bacteroides xylanisolvens TaxID=371601 RepID=A0A921I6Q0_9BACE|nr:DUF3244 domain-containing protein [Bacteroides xylanisolvens]